jgi:hypothetical protein
MHANWNRTLLALRQLRHDGQQVEPGEFFYATETDAGFLIAGGAAELAKDEKTNADTLQIPPATSQQGTGGEASDAGQAEGTTGSTQAEPPADKPSDGLTVAQIKERLTKRGIEIPATVTLKADLAALLDGAAQG